MVIINQRKENDVNYIYIYTNTYIKGIGVIDKNKSCLNL